MKNAARNIVSSSVIALLVSMAGVVWIRTADAQGQELQQRVAEVKQAVAQNKRDLMSYSWNELIIISLKGEQKKQEHFQVRLGPDGTSVKTSLDPPVDAAPSGGHLKQHIVAKKKEEYTDYANAMKALAQEYVPPSGDLLQQAYAQGNITLGPTASAPNEVQLVVHNYLKSQDSMTLVFDREQKALLSVTIASYMSDPKDAMSLKVTFSRLPDGTNHVNNVVMDGVSKQLNIATQNSNYQHV
jgi:hypothetical protein